MNGPISGTTLALPRSRAPKAAFAVRPFSLYSPSSSSESLESLASNSSQETKDERRKRAQSLGQAKAAAAASAAGERREHKEEKDKEKDSSERDSERETENDDNESEQSSGSGSGSGGAGGQRRSFSVQLSEAPLVRDDYFDPDEPRAMLEGFASGDDGPVGADVWVEVKAENFDPSLFKSKSYQELEEVVVAMKADPNLRVKSRVWRQQTFANSFVGSELVDWMLEHLRDSWGLRDRKTASLLGNALIDCGFIRKIKHSDVNNIFLDLHVFYHFTTPPLVVLNAKPPEHKAAPDKKNERKKSDRAFVPLAGVAPPAPPHPVEVSIRALAAAADLFRRCAAEAAAPTDAPLRFRREFRTLTKHAEELRYVCLDNLDFAELRCLFINVYNTLLMHALTQSRPPQGREEWVSFCRSNAYTIGDRDLNFSLLDIEFGVLRARLPCLPLSGLKQRDELRPLVVFPPKFPPSDSRHKFCLPELDPRLSFVLCRACVDSPDLRILTLETAEQQLTQAAQLYIKDHVALTYTTSIPQPAAPPAQAQQPAQGQVVEKAQPLAQPASAAAAAQSPAAQAAVAVALSASRANIEQQLQLQQQPPLARGERSERPERPELVAVLPGVFWFFRSEFGKSPAKILGWIAELHWDWIEQSKIADFLHAKAFTVSFKPYDWTSSVAALALKPDRSAELATEDD